MAFVIVTPSPTLSVEDLRAHLRLTDPADDELLAAYIAAAVEWFQNRTNTTLPTTTAKQFNDAFPARRGDLLIQRPPLVSVQKVEYLDAGGTLRTLSTATYSVDSATRPGRISLNPGHNWPATAAAANAVRIELTAGHAVLPAILAQGIRFLVGHYYENREAVADKAPAEVPFAIESIAEQFYFPEAV